MRRSVLVLTACIAIAIAATAGAQSIEQQLKDRLLGSTSATSNLNERDAASGIKEALA